MKQKSPINPFYAGVAIAGVLFALTACAYGVVAVRAMRGIPETAGFFELIDKRGPQWMMYELVALAVTTFGAIGLDKLRTEREMAGAGEDAGDSPE